MGEWSWRANGNKRGEGGQGEGEMGWEIRNVFFFNDTATTEIYTLSLHDALPISTSVPRSPVKLLVL